MTKKRLIVFFSVFTISFILVNALFLWNGQRTIELQTQRMRSLHAEMAAELRIYMNYMLHKAVVLSEYLTSEKNGMSSYETIAQEVLGGDTDILGLNLLDSRGKVINVYPSSKNSNILGQTSQNFPYMVAAIQNRQEFWLSPPFPLLQGPVGIALYVPFYKDGKQVGWTATVIDMANFVKKFFKQEPFSKFGMAIIDVESGRNYFNSQKIPNEEINYKSEIIIRGRSIQLISWPENNLDSEMTFTLAFFIALLLASLLTYSFRMLDP